MNNESVTNLVSAIGAAITNSVPGMITSTVAVKTTAAVTAESVNTVIGIITAIVSQLVLAWLSRKGWLRLAPMLLLAPAGLAAFCLSGCALFGPTDKQVEAMTKSYGKWLDQPRFIDHMRLIGSNITITGVSELVVSGPLEPLPMIPRDPTITEALVDGAKTVAPYAAGVMLLKDHVGGGNSTVNNYGEAAP